MSPALVSLVMLIGVVIGFLLALLATRWQLLRAMRAHQEAIEASGEAMKHTKEAYRLKIDAEGQLKEALEASRLARECQIEAMKVINAGREPAKK